MAEQLEPDLAAANPEASDDAAPSTSTSLTVPNDEVQTASTAMVQTRPMPSPGILARVWRTLFGAPRPPSVLSRLGLGERSRTLLGDNTLRILQESFRLAEESMHRAVRHEHVLRLTLEHPDVHRLLVNVEADVETLISAMQQRVAQLPTVVSEDHIALAEPSLLRAVHRAMVFVLGTEREQVRPVDLFLAIMAELEPELAALFQSHGCTRFQLVLFLSHGVLAHPTTFDDVDDGTVRVVMHNDHYTTQEWVVYVLHDKFGLDPSEARGFMLEIHNHGQATVTHMDKAKASGMVKEILDESTTAGMPLKITLASAY